jgi:membrane protein implicated in regulation of membrane protease activity
MLVSELLTPGGFYLLFIGIAAIITGIISPFICTTWIDITLFALILTFCIAILRKPLVASVKKSTPKSDITEFIGETATTITDIPAGKEGKIELRGTIWNGKNESTIDLSKNAQCTITARDGLLLLLKPKM